jgi:hypothetical protein
MLSTKHICGRRRGVQHACGRCVSVRAVNVDQLKSAKAAVAELVRKSNCAPIIVRLGAQITYKLGMYFYWISDLTCCTFEKADNVVVTTFAGTKPAKKQLRLDNMRVSA